MAVAGLFPALLYTLSAILDGCERRGCSRTNIRCDMLYKYSFTQLRAGSSQFTPWNFSPQALRVRRLNVAIQK